MTTRLLIDNSNTRTKFIRADGAKLCGDVRSLPTSSLSPSAVQDLLRGWEYDAAVICSVVPDAVKILRAALSCPSFEISASFPTSLGKQLLRYYPHPETLGADRLANAAAVAAHTPLPCIAADLGTACTFDAIDLRDGSPALIGGAITPGLQAFASALSSTTAQLPSIPLPNSLLASLQPLMATNTREAILAGCVHGFRGMTEGILRDFGELFGSPPAIVLTGGDAPLCASLPFPSIEIDNLLTFKGMLRLIL